MRLTGVDLACQRGERDVFAGVSFAVASGEALTISGRNGAGKSSLLRMIIGLLPIAAGRLTLEGGDPELSIAEQAHYLGHQDALKGSLSVAENLRFWAGFFGARSTDLREPARGGRARRARGPAGRLSFGRTAPTAVDRPADRGAAPDLAARRADQHARRGGAGSPRRIDAARISPAAASSSRQATGRSGLPSAPELRLGDAP